jgi:hypothetical protein
MEFFAATEYITNFFYTFDIDREISPSLSPATGRKRHHFPLPFNSGTYGPILVL